MPLFFGDNYYLNDYYGGDDDDTAAGAIPSDLRYYRTNVDNVYVVHWGFAESFIHPGLGSLDYDLEIDSEDTFDSSNLLTYDSSTVISFQNGNVRKGFAIPVAVRLDGLFQTWFVRVRSKSGMTTSDWSDTLTITILPKFQVETAERLIGNLPDGHVYGKEDVLKAVAARTTNLYTVMDTYAQEFDQVQLENILTTTDIYIESSRDEALYDTFGVFFKFPKAADQAFVEYRMILLRLLQGALVGGTPFIIKSIVKGFTGVTPDIQLIRNREDFFLSEIDEVPPETVNGVRTFFSVSSDYIPGTLVLLNNDTVLVPGVDFTENHATIGFDMTVAPTGTLRAIFTIGVLGDPDPVVLDLTDSTTLTGTVTFTQGSKVVTGSGTAFLSEVGQGRILTDTDGEYMGYIALMSSDTSLMLKEPWIGPTTSGATAKLVNFNGTFHLTGTPTFANGSTSVTSSGSKFLSELKIGDSIIDNTDTAQGIVVNILSNDSLTLRDVWAGSSGTSVNARKLIYSEPILWDRATLAHGIILRVLNPGEFTLNTATIESLVEQFLPAHVKVFYSYE